MEYPILADACERFDPASIAILDRLNQVLARLDEIPSAPTPVLSGPADLASSSTLRIPETPPVARGAVSAPGDEYDELHIPSGRTTPDAILQWPIFEHQYPSTYLIDATFAAEMPDDDSESESNTRTSKAKGSGYSEGQILERVQKFFDLVHIKNPILDQQTVWSYAQAVVEDGLEWDSSSCLVVSTIAM